MAALLIRACNFGQNLTKTKVFLDKRKQSKRLRDVHTINIDEKSN